MKTFIKFIAFLIFIILIYKGLSFEKSNSALVGSKLETIITKRKIKTISELATASQMILIKTDTVYTSKESNDIKFCGYTLVSFNAKNVENQLIYVQRFNAKAGFKNVEIWQKDSVIEIIYSSPEILSFEMLKDSIISEKGTWTKTGTAALEEINKDKAKQRINHDSLFAASQRNFRKIISGILQEIAPNKAFTFKRK